MWAILLLALASHAENVNVTECTMVHQKLIEERYSYVGNCASTHGCADDDGDNRRRLEDDEEMTLLQAYSCYCNKCAGKMVNLQNACNSCDVVNYVPCYENDDGECEDDEDGGEDGNSFFEQYCMIDNLVVIPHADDFCSMMTGVSDECMSEMSYMIMQPEEEEEDDDDDNGRRRRRLKDNDDDENIVQPEDLFNCMIAPFAGAFGTQETYNNMEYCAQLCTMYANNTYWYMQEELPAQSCGLSVSYYSHNAASTETLPDAVQHQGIVCVSNSCTATDTTLMAKYSVAMAAYSRFVAFDMEGDGNNNNNNNNDDDQNMDMFVDKIVPLTVGAWKCNGNGSEGIVENDDYPDFCPSPEPSEKEESASDEKWATAAMFAIVCGLGMGIFMCLFVYYYRQVANLKEQARPTTDPNVGI